ncbi:MAG: M56 family metallopeptidase [Roseburia sp.]|nr:M56 family metallopeptidase [Roseburia sp.]MCM1098751.1 M56 family metallopeptidase [Ruminococcus flavefaciens]
MSGTAAVPSAGGVVSGVPAGIFHDIASRIADFDRYAPVWLIGVLACAAFFSAAYLKCRREFRESLPVDSGFAPDWLKAHPLRRRLQIRQSDRISAPLTYGVFRPVILLPGCTDWSDREALDYVLTHEYIHIRRFDAVAKLALTAALCIHWFNPTVWTMYVLANRDIELSCDEAVIRRFGERIKSAYAMTLIRLEETKSGLRPLCNNFSKNATEERILAIMKIKKTTRMSSFIALALILSVTTAFATSAQTQDGGQDSQNPDQKQSDRFSSTYSETVYDDVNITSYTDPKDGKTYYSRDNGKTWTALTDEEVETMYRAAEEHSAWDGVEWWTAEEYAAWLEQEKAALQSVIGDRGWNPTDGWYTWTQEMADEAIARYEQTLKDIQAGMKVSKPTADGDTMIQLGYDPALQATATDITAVLGMAIAMDSIPGDMAESGSAQTLTPELLADYKTYGLTWDDETKAFSFNGKTVRYFFDGYTLENGTATIYDYVNEDGVVDVHTVRQATRNADGSIDPGGRLTGIEEYSREEFDNRFLMNPTMTQESTALGFVGDTGGTTFEERFAQYKDFGITYEEADGVSGRGNVYLNGQLVSRFADVSPDGSAFSFTSAEQGGISAQTVYDQDGNLTGVKVVAH